MSKAIKIVMLALLAALGMIGVMKVAQIAFGFNPGEFSVIIPAIAFFSIIVIVGGSIVKIQ